MWLTSASGHQPLHHGRRFLAKFDYGLFARTLALITVACTYCAVVGGSILVFPPTVVLVEIAIPIIFMLWGAPDIKVDYSSSLTILIHLFAISQISIPNFYAIPITGIGWVNLRKIEIVSLLGITALAYATSQEVRARALAIIQASKLFNCCVIGFLAALIMSVPLSRTPQVSLGSLAQPLTTWYLIYFAVLAVKDMHLEFDAIAKTIVANIIFLAIICIIERHLQRRVMFDIMPASLIIDLLNNPSFSMLYLSSGIRSGAFRAAASFTTPLSTGECAAMVLPFTYYLAFHKEGVFIKIFGCIGIGAVAAVLYTANARGAMLAAIAASVVYLMLVILLLSRRNRSSLIPALVSLTAISTLPAVTFTDKFRYTVLGGGATTASNAGRTEQLRLAIPKFFQSPIWGHGLSTGAEVVGFNPGNYFTLDSYAIAVAIEMGLPGLLCLLGMVFFPIIAASKLLVTTDGSPLAILGVTLALPIFAFSVNMIVLTQIENHGFLFLIFALFATWRSYAISVAEGSQIEAVELPHHGQGWARVRG